MVAPLIFILVFGLMEWSRMEMIRQATSTAAFNAARMGTIPGVTTTDVRDRAQRILDVYMVNTSNITATITDAKSTVSVTVPMNENSWFLKKIYGDLTIGRDFTIHR